jgi:hypothetical protein
MPPTRKPERVAGTSRTAGFEPLAITTSSPASAAAISFDRWRFAA